MTRDDGAQKEGKPNFLLREARNRMGLSHQEVAKAIDLPDPHTIGRWERGVSFPRAHYRLRLSTLFGKSLEELGLIPQEQQREQQIQESEPLELAEIPVEVSRYKHTIKPSFTSFIGREGSVTRVCELLKRPDIRLVTILGPGGVGKTRLAREVAWASQEQFADDICMVSLSALREAALVLPTIARELQLRENGAHTLAKDLQGFFRKKPAFLLILDNFEHLLDANSTIELLLANCPCLKVLVTSRSVLNISGEHEFALDPLPLPAPGTNIDELLHYPAIQLFVERAQARLDTFQASPENLPLINTICGTLDGLPLAIELAAARVKMFPLPALLEEISENRLRLRIPQSETPLQRQTLADTIKWSYDLLDEQEQWLFRRLAVFPGGSTLSAAKKIWQSSPSQKSDTLSILMSLLDKNMLRPVAQEKAQPFFLMLETIRDYGVSLLQQQGELDSARQALARYAQELLEAAEPFLKGPQQGKWLATLDQERQNLSAALAWLLESKDSETALAFCEIFGKFCGLRGYWSEEAHWLKAVLDLSNNEPTSKLRGRVLGRAAHLAYRQRDLPTAHKLFAESIAIAKELDDQHNLAGALSGLARVLYREQDLSSASQLLAQSVEAARNSADPWSLANALESLSSFSFEQGNTDEASQFLEEGIALARGIEDSESLARLLNTAVAIEIERKHFDAATELARESFAVATALGNKPLIALALNGLADAAVAQGAFERAKELYTQRLQLARELNDEPTIALMKLKLSELALKQGEVEHATVLAEESLRFFQAHGDHPNSHLASNLLAKIKRQHEEEQSSN
jgi:predicted ATPase/transcriptional regulator with XRE-family HTH domain